MKLLAKLSAVVIFAAIALSALSACAADSEEENFIKLFLTPASAMPGEAQDSVRESGGSTYIDLDDDGRKETVLVWMRVDGLGRHDNLTIFSNKDGFYKEMDTMELTGESRLVRAEGRTIVIDRLELVETDPKCCPSLHRDERYAFQLDQVKLAKNDPACCPSVHREEHYAFQNGKIVKLH